MAEQADAAALCRQLYKASRDGEAAEVAHLLDLNALIEHREGLPAQRGAQRGASRVAS